MTNVIMNYILNWNCLGYHTHLAELNILVNNFSPSIINIQETKFNYKYTPNYNNYKSYYKSLQTNTIAHGGVITLVRENLTSSEVHLNTTLQAVAIKIYHPIEHVICNIYLPGNENVMENELIDLISQLGPIFLLQGDFNAHHFLWGSQSINSRGKLIEKIINDNSLIIMNSGDPTHFSLQHRTFSCIDLSIASPIITWNVDKNGYLKTLIGNYIKTPYYSTTKLLTIQTPTLTQILTVLQIIYRMQQ